jgi:hypothetical protein
VDSNVLLVLCLVVLIGLGVPAMIYAGLRRGGSVGQIELLRRASKNLRHPWQREDSQLAELSKRVEALQTKPDRSAK